ncbi:MAG: ion transporter [Bacteroidales bacterium]|nr:ion transporter [Candidatus Colimorpha onthohippi]
MNFRRYVNLVIQSVLSFLDTLMHRILFDCLLPRRYRDLSKSDFFEIIFRSDTPRGKRFDIWLLVLIVLNIVLMMFDSMMGHTTLTGATEDKVFSYWIVDILEWCFTLIFTFEFYLRIYCIKNPKSYLKSFYGVIDMLSIFPAYLSIFFPGAQALMVFRLLRVLRIFRIFKMQRFMYESRFLLRALRSSAVRIMIFMLIVVVFAVILGTLIFAIEGDINPAISSIPRGIYWAVVTITTVGYGDIAPVTGVGQFVSIIVMLLGYAIIAVPTGIVAGETIYEHRRQDKEAAKTEEIDLAPADDDDK